jgi:hypothetical protein
MVQEIFRSLFILALAWLVLAVSMLFIFSHYANPEDLLPLEVARLYISVCKANGHPLKHIDTEYEMYGMHSPNYYKIYGRQSAEDKPLVRKQ